MHHRRRLVALCGVVAACALPTPPPTVVIPICDASIQPAVTDSSSGTFNWAPFCGYAGVDVSRLGGPPLYIKEGVWSIASNTSGLVPPLTYGVLPPGAQTVLAPQALERGKTYEAAFMGRSHLVASFVQRITWTVP